MKSKIFAVLLAGTLALGLVPHAVYAATDEVTSGLNMIKNPFPHTTLLDQGPAGVLQYAIKLLLLLSGIVAVLFIILGGYQFMTSAGNEEGATKGKKTLTYAVIGLVIIMLSWALVTVVVNLVSTGTIGNVGTVVNSGNNNNNNQRPCDPDIPDDCPPPTP